MIVAQPADTPPRASLLQVVKAVLSAFIGIRKGAAHDRDIATLKPAQVIAVGIGAAVVLVLSLVALVRLIITMN
jgi:hypothetical protein